MRSSNASRRGRRFLAAGATSVLMVLGSAGAVSAQAAPDQHSGGESPNTLDRDSGGGGTADTTAEGSSSLPVTGSDVTGLLAMGAGAVALGAGAVAASRRRSTHATS